MLMTPRERLRKAINHEEHCLSPLPGIRKKSSDLGDRGKKTEKKRRKGPFE